MKSDDTKEYYGECPAEFCPVKHLIVIYTNINDYQYNGDTKCPLLLVIN